MSLGLTHGIDMPAGNLVLFALPEEENQGTLREYRKLRRSFLAL
jgi:hypothetical protein